MRYFASLTFVCLAFAGSVLAQADLKKLDAYYSKALADWAVPGMSIAIVKDGQIIFSKGYGVKEIGKPGKPDAKSLFAIASNTRAIISSTVRVDRYQRMSPLNVRRPTRWHNRSRMVVSAEIHGS